MTVGQPVRTVNGPAVELQRVSRLYGSGSNGVAALDNVNLACPAGTWTAIMGPSGSGKSTLLHCTAAPDNVLTEMRRRVSGFVFQSFNLIGSLTAEQNVAFPLKMAGVRVSRSEVRRPSPPSPANRTTS